MHSNTDALSRLPTARSSPFGVSEALGVAEGAIVVVPDRVFLNLDERPVEWRMGWRNLAGKHYCAQIG